MSARAARERAAADLEQRPSVCPSPKRESLATIASRLDRRPRPSHDPAGAEGATPGDDSRPRLRSARHDQRRLPLPRDRPLEPAGRLRSGHPRRAALPGWPAHRVLGARGGDHSDRDVSALSRRDGRLPREVRASRIVGGATQSGDHRSVAARIRDDGAMASRHFERPDGRSPKPGTWYGGKPARQALDHLWSRGDIMVAAPRERLPTRLRRHRARHPRRLPGRPPLAGGATAPLHE